MSDLIEVNCFCCGRELEAEPRDNPMVLSGLYNALWFRSNGNYGSTVFDPLTDSLEELLQIVICDCCIKAKIKEVEYIYNIRNRTTSELKTFELDGS